MRQQCRRSTNRIHSCRRSQRTAVSLKRRQPLYLTAGTTTRRWELTPDKRSLAARLDFD